MATWNITGKWGGQYEYAPNDMMPTPPAPVTFTLIARQGWFGRFSGIIQEDPPHGVPEQARIWGRVSPTGLTFSKQYSAFYVISDAKPVTLQNYLEVDHGLELDRDVVSQPIQYDGVYNMVDQSVQGTWRMSDHGIRFRSRGQWMEAEVLAPSGTWRMQRKASD